jgi:hypothetical protein
LCYRNSGGISYNTKKLRADARSFVIPFQYDDPRPNQADTFAGLIFTPGPIVGATEMLLR